MQMICYVAELVSYAQYPDTIYRIYSRNILTVLFRLFPHNLFRGRLSQMAFIALNLHAVSDMKLHYFARLHNNLCFTVH